MDNQPIVKQVEQWLRDVVVGLNLCPFARKPLRAGQIRFQVSSAKDDETLLADLLQELQRLDETPVERLETTLLIVPAHLQEFYAYNNFLDQADWLLEANDYSGTYQVASFHPHYQFAGSAPEDAENLTNRAPYPILHLLREASLDKALAQHPNPETIPQTNIVRVESLSDQERRQLFPFLFS